MFAFIVLDLVFFSRDWLGSTSRKGPILCQVRRKNLSQSIPSGVATWYLLKKLNLTTKVSNAKHSPVNIKTLHDTGSGGALGRSGTVAGGPQDAFLSFT